MTGLLLLALLAAPPVSLQQVRAEPKLERRAELAIEFAGVGMARARKIVADAGSITELSDSLNQIGEACQLALNSLRQTGKRPNKLGKQYKRAELRTRALVRELTDLVSALPMDNREQAEKVLKHIQSLHEEFLLGVMGGK